ncbi:hypothetical protein BN140_2548 [Methanoculleus bourgensis MS2]|jgi:hypothetical protein|uniref:PGF-pre-PGF domain-containing protein n=1 Tax=Methanoculleus bourgensis (strain ATCC 43281 / DSM 3045 / OCM 15 / MS2) TaxID=1201294 RepID=I7KE54_METBM|nr:hypothetical protein [Methanoculleus bourgensis]CCJ37471.1 hypothetical protein BN140_2548 [Methanoculleus bourgensis MS2]
MRHTPWILILLFALIGPASAIPLLPAEFSGTVTIDGSPAPAGTVITARFDGRDCGSLTLTTAGAFGGDSTFDKRLLVSGEDGDAGKSITFLVDGVLAAGTAVYTPGTSTSLALAVAKGGSSGGTSSGPSGGGGGGGGPSGSSFMPPAPAAPVMEYTGSGSLNTDMEGVVRYTTVIATVEGGASLSIGQGVLAQDRFGRPLDAVSVRSTSQGDLPASGSGAEPVARALRCGPDGATFDPAIEVSFTLTPDEWERSGVGERFVVQWYNSETGAWEPLTTTVHPATHTVTATISHFTLVAVFIEAVPVETLGAGEVATGTDAGSSTTGITAAAPATEGAGLPLLWLAGLGVIAVLVGVILLVHIRQRG